MVLPISMKRLRDHYERGDNIMQLLRDAGVTTDSEAVLAAYDLQAGSYVEAMQAPGYSALKIEYASAIAKVLDQLGGRSILEAGVGEATTISHVIPRLTSQPIVAAGFDISWSRVAKGRIYARSHAPLSLVVGDLFAIPAADNSFDVVYTSHSIEPNRGLEKAALKELYRVARRHVVLFEPAATYGSEATKSHIEHHHYCTDLNQHALELGFDVKEHRLFDIALSEENQTELLIIFKNAGPDEQADNMRWIACPLCRTPLVDHLKQFYCEECCLVYPRIGDIPCLLSGAGILASNFLSINPDK
jgi:ubiquinone/menaquinone biosynthesis C-methylase UbiE